MRAQKRSSWVPHLGCERDLGGFTLLVAGLFEGGPVECALFGSSCGTRKPSASGTSGLREMDAVTVDDNGSREQELCLFSELRDYRGELDVV